ncbi:MAG: excinuclease ABC subunit UvrC [Candidatus Cloacimonetes bacterium]|nr:excinuclease ABC subunit UvrC [Candidatus Cloacimonadota bacterium]MCF7814979.1 excinuclease ABC subunit UvrC [Candidatus Cloacimonadota bacterium]MCF7869329.1 excinuclease ABC subunit UvrC [Candidatus Cloacimonadota bacterium]MCF7884298.1 excinuclease ABC subunit UvrC [Candidatus Cloacimonadota bacterium]
MPQVSDKIKQKLTLLPDSAGVYLMKNAKEKVIYVGKAKVLKNRVRSYFSGTPVDAKTQELVTKIVDIDYILTKTEEQALVLEANLIKKYRPKYNINLKDDKQYPFIKITSKEDFPRIFVTRNLVKDGSKYFGPYTDSRAIRKTLRLMEWIFPLRTCGRTIMEGGKLYKRACVNFQMGKCPGPCVGKISKTEYQKIINNAVNFLNGRNQDVIDELMKQMKEYGEKLEFEKAAQTRDKISDIQKVNSSRNLFFTDQKNRDVIGLYKEDKKAAVAVLKVLSGKLLNKEIYNMDNVEGRNISQILSAFLLQYYAEKMDTLPHRILVQTKPQEYEILNKWLKNKLIIPQRGEKKSIIIIARDNAFNQVEEQKLKYLRKSNRTIFPIKELKDKLGLKKLPRKMICLDISTIQGTDTVSSLVFFENGKPKKKNYRHYIIKTVKGQDDFASLAETLKRYLNKIEEQEKPDLIVIDGGKGQLSSAYQILQENNLPDIEMISLAKRLEEVFLPGRSDSVILPRSSSALRVLVNLRDEAHRFAITFHRKKRSKRTLQSELDKITGVGDKTKFLLLKEFGSVENIAKASLQDLMNIKGLGKKTAEKIFDSLR